MVMAGMGRIEGRRESFDAQPYTSAGPTYHADCISSNASTVCFTDPGSLSVQPIRIHLDVPDVFRSKAMYGIRMLMLPFRVEPAWVERSGKGDEQADFYYGSNPDGATNARIGVVLREKTVSWFTSGKSEYPPFKHVRIDDTRIPVCFEADGAWSFDPVATVFFLLSGWQEVVGRRRDEHGRFPFEASFQAHTDARLVPIVEWVRHIVSDALSKAGKPLERRTFGEQSWAFCATHDIDYIRKWRPGIWKRELLDRAVLNQASESPVERLDRARRAVWSFFETGDPFRTALTRIPAELEARRARGTFFYKAAAHGFRDVDYSLSDPIVRSAIEKQQQAGHEVGLHPSYHSHAHPKRMQEERDQLKAATGGPIKSYRAHYLRYDHPTSLHHIGAAGFSVDSTLGWAHCAGYRFGTCLPFPLYDPVSDEESTLWEVPLLAMESALFNRQHLSSQEAIDDTRSMMDVCKAFGGVFTGLWHNTLWDETDYPGWGAHFEAALDHAQASGARMDTLSAVLSDWK